MQDLDFVYNYIDEILVASASTEEPYLPTRPLGQDMTQGQFLSGV